MTDFADYESEKKKESRYDDIVNADLSSDELSAFSPEGDNVVKAEMGQHILANFNDHLAEMYEFFLLHKNKQYIRVGNLKQQQENIRDIIQRITTRKNSLPQGIINGLSALKNPKDENRGKYPEEGAESLYNSFGSYLEEYIRYRQRHYRSFISLQHVLSEKNQREQGLSDKRSQRAIRISLLASRLSGYLTQTFECLDWAAQAELRPWREVEDRTREKLINQLLPITADRYDREIAETRATLSGTNPANMKLNNLIHAELWEKRRQVDKKRTTQHRPELSQNDSLSSLSALLSRDEDAESGVDNGDAIPETTVGSMSQVLTSVLQGLRLNLKAAEAELLISPGQGSKGKRSDDAAVIQDGMDDNFIKEIIATCKRLEPIVSALYAAIELSLPAENSLPDSSEKSNSLNIKEIIGNLNHWSPQLPRVFEAIPWQLQRQAGGQFTKMWDWLKARLQLHTLTQEEKEAVLQAGWVVKDKLQQTRATLFRIYQAAQPLMAAWQHADALEQLLVDSKTPVLDRALQITRDEWQSVIKKETAELEAYIASKMELSRPERHTRLLLDLVDMLSTEGQTDESKSILEGFLTQLKNYSQYIASVETEIEKIPAHVNRSKDHRQMLPDIISVLGKGMQDYGSTLNLELSQLIGREPGSFSHSGMLAKGIASLHQERKREWLSTQTADTDPVAVEKHYDAAFLKIIEGYLPLLSPEHDKSGKVLLQRVRTEMVHATDGSTLYPTSMANMLAGQKSISDKLKSSTVRRLIRKNLSAVFGSVSYLPSLATLPLRIAIKCTLTGALVTYAIRKGGHAVRLGEGSAKLEARQYGENAFKQVAISIGLGLTGPVSHGIAAAFLWEDIYRGRSGDAAKSVAKEVFTELPFMGTTAVARKGVTNGINMLQQAALEKELQQVIARIKEKAASATRQKARSRRNVSGESSQPAASTPSANEELSQIAAGDNAELAAAAKRLQALTGSQQLRMQWADAADGSHYDLATRTIMLEAGASEEEILHEIAHALSAHRLRVSEDSPLGEKVRELDKLREVALQAYQRAGGDDNETLRYMGNLDEFVAGLYSGDSEFRQFLGRIDVNGRSLLAQALELLCLLLGLDAAQDSALSKAMGLSEEVMSTPLTEDEGSGQGKLYKRPAHQIVMPKAKKVGVFEEGYVNGALTLDVDVPAGFNVLLAVTYKNGNRGSIIVPIPAEFRARAHWQLYVANYVNGLPAGSFGIKIGEKDRAGIITPIYSRYKNYIYVDSGSTVNSVNWSFTNKNTLSKKDLLLGDLAGKYQQPLLNRGTRLKLIVLDRDMMGNITGQRQDLINIETLLTGEKIITDSVTSRSLTKKILEWPNGFSNGLIEALQSDTFRSMYNSTNEKDILTRSNASRPFDKLNDIYGLSLNADTELTVVTTINSQRFSNGTVTHDDLEQDDQITLHDLIIDQPELKEQQAGQKSTIVWPQNYPPDLISKLQSFSFILYYTDQLPEDKRKLAYNKLRPHLAGMLRNFSEEYSLDESKAFLALSDKVMSTSSMDNQHNNEDDNKEVQITFADIDKKSKRVYLKTSELSNSPANHPDSNKLRKVTDVETQEYNELKHKFLQNLGKDQALITPDYISIFIKEILSLDPEELITVSFSPRSIPDKQFTLKQVLSLGFEPYLLYGMEEKVFSYKIKWDAGHSKMLKNAFNHRELISIFDEADENLNILNHDERFRLNKNIEFLRFNNANAWVTYKIQSVLDNYGINNLNLNEQRLAKIIFPVEQPTSFSLTGVGNAGARDEVLNQRMSIVQYLLISKNGGVSSDERPNKAGSVKWFSWPDSIKSKPGLITELESINFESAAASDVEAISTQDKSISKEVIKGKVHKLLIEAGIDIEDGNLNKLHQFMVISPRHAKNNVVDSVIAEHISPQHGINYREKDYIPVPGIFAIPLGVTSSGSKKLLLISLATEEFKYFEYSDKDLVEAGNNKRTDNNSQLFDNEHATWIKNHLSLKDNNIKLTDSTVQEISRHYAVLGNTDSLYISNKTTTRINFKLSNAQYDIKGISDYLYESNLRKVVEDIAVHHTTSYERVLGKLKTLGADLYACVGAALAVAGVATGNVAFMYLGLSASVVLSLAPAIATYLSADNDADRNAAIVDIEAYFFMELANYVVGTALAKFTSAVSLGVRKAMQKITLQRLKRLPQRETLVVDGGATRSGRVVNRAPEQLMVDGGATRSGRVVNRAPEQLMVDGGATRSGRVVNRAPEQLMVDGGAMRSGHVVSTHQPRAVLEIRGELRRGRIAAPHPQDDMKVFHTQNHRQPAPVESPVPNNQQATSVNPTPEQLIPHPQDDMKVFHTQNHRQPAPVEFPVPNNQQATSVKSAATTTQQANTGLSVPEPHEQVAALLNTYYVVNKSGLVESKFRGLAAPNSSEEASEAGDNPAPISTDQPPADSDNSLTSPQTKSRRRRDLSSQAHQSTNNREEDGNGSALKRKDLLLGELAREYNQPLLNSRTKVRLIITDHNMRGDVISQDEQEIDIDTVLSSEERNWVDLNLYTEPTIRIIWPAGYSNGLKQRLQSSAFRSRYNSTSTSETKVIEPPTAKQKPIEATRQPSARVKVDIFSNTAASLDHMIIREARKQGLNYTRSDLNTMVTVNFTTSTLMEDVTTSQDYTLRDVLLGNFYRDEEPGILTDKEVSGAVGRPELIMPKINAVRDNVAIAMKSKVDTLSKSFNFIKKSQLEYKNRLDTVLSRALLKHQPHSSFVKNFIEPYLNGNIKPKTLSITAPTHIASVGNVNVVSTTQHQKYDIPGVVVLENSRGRKLLISLKTGDIVFSDVNHLTLANFILPHLSKFDREKIRYNRYSASWLIETETPRSEIGIIAKYDPKSGRATESIINQPIWEKLRDREVKLISDNIDYQIYTTREHSVERQTEYFKSLMQAGAFAAGFIAMGSTGGLQAAALTFGLGLEAGEIAASLRQMNNADRGNRYLAAAEDAFLGGLLSAFFGIDDAASLLRYAAKNTSIFHQVARQARDYIKKISSGSDGANHLLEGLSKFSASPRVRAKYLAEIFPLEKDSDVFTAIIDIQYRSGILNIMERDELLAASKINDYRKLYPASSRKINSQQELLSIPPGYRMAIYNDTQDYIDEALSLGEGRFYIEGSIVDMSHGLKWRFSDDGIIDDAGDQLRVIIADDISEDNFISILSTNGTTTTTPLPVEHGKVDNEPVVQGPGGRNIQHGSQTESNNGVTLPGKSVEKGSLIFDLEPQPVSSGTQRVVPGAQQESSSKAYPLDDDEVANVNNNTLSTGDNFEQPFGKDSWIEMGPTDNVVIIRAHGAPGDTGHYTATGVVAVIRHYLHRHNIPLENIRYIELQSCYGNTLGPFSQAQAIANKLQVNVKGYSGLFDDTRAVDPGDGSISRPFSNPVLRRLSKAGNSAAYNVSEAVLSTRRRLGISTSPSILEGNTVTYPLTQTYDNAQPGHRRVRPHVPNNFNVMSMGRNYAQPSKSVRPSMRNPLPLARGPYERALREAELASDTVDKPLPARGPYERTLLELSRTPPTDPLLKGGVAPSVRPVITGQAVDSSMPVTAAYGRALIDLSRTVPADSPMRAGVLISMMLLLGGVGVYAGSLDFEAQGVKNALENAEKNLTDIKTLMGSDDPQAQADLQTILRHYVGDENLSPDDIQQLISFINKIRTTATDFELRQLPGGNGTLPDKFSEDVPAVLSRLSPSEVIGFYLHIFGKTEDGE